jgi:transcriptional regulator with XRE-family HTH domain
VTLHATRPFAPAVRDLLHERDWSQRRLATAAGLDPASLSRALRGAQHAGPNLAARVAAALDLPEHYFPECRESLVIDAVRGNPELRDRLFVRISDAGPEGAWL